MAVALRETSVLFVILIGVLFLTEPIDPKRSVLMVMIAAGVVAIKMEAQLA